MKKFKKQIPARYLIGLLAALSLGATYSARNMLEIGPTASVTGPNPKIEFKQNDRSGEDWEIEASNDSVGFFEIAPLGTLAGLAPFKIADSANRNSLTVNDSGVVVNGSSGSSELNIFGDAGQSDSLIALSLSNQPHGKFVELALEQDSESVVLRSGTSSRAQNEMFRGSILAPDNSVTIDENGDVGIGVPLDEINSTGTYPARLHLSANNGTNLIRFDEGVRSDVSRKLGSFINGIFGLVIEEVGEDPKLPFAIFGDAIGSSLVVRENMVGLGTHDPNTSLHLLREDGSALVRIEEASPTTGRRKMLELINNGPSKLEMTNTDSGRTWSIIADVNDSFNIRQNGPNTANMAIRADGTFSFNSGGSVLLSIKPDGNAFLPQGTLTELSDRNSKENVQPIDPSEVLTKVVDLPLSTWNYISDENDAQHLGPMAQDFYAEFELGVSEKRIATIDTSGVALAAVQGLNVKLESEVKELRSQNEELLRRMEQLERVLETVNPR